MMVRQLVCEGDSLTAGGINSYPSQALALLGNHRWTLHNKGVSASEIANVSARASTVDALTRSRYQNNVFILWIGTNDLRTPSVVSSLESAIQTYCQNRRSAGWDKILLATIISRNPASTSGNVNWETDRGTMNTWFRNSTSSFRDGLVDLAADNRIGDSGDYADTTYFNADGVHLNNTGLAIVAAAVRAAIVTLLGDQP